MVYYREKDSKNPREGDIRWASLLRPSHHTEEGPEVTPLAVTVRRKLMRAAKTWRESKMISSGQGLGMRVILAGHRIFRPVTGHSDRYVSSYLWSNQEDVQH